MIVLKLRLKLFNNLFFLIVLTIFLISFYLFSKFKINEYEVFGYIKPITFIQYSGFLLFILILRRFKHIFYKHNLNFMIAIGFVFLMATSFEVMWAFGYWFSVNTIINQEHINSAYYLDTIEYIPSTEFLYNYFGGKFDENKNFNVISKKNTLFMFMAIYYLYFLLDIKNESIHNRLQ